MTRLVYDSSFPESVRVQLGKQALECLLYISLDIPMGDEASVLMHRLSTSMRCVLCVCVCVCV